MSKLRIDFNG